MADQNIRLVVKVNHRRAQAILQEGRGLIRRARKVDRPAVVDRLTLRFLEECVRVGPA